MAHLREVLNDSAERPKYIETLPKHGYRFIAAVTDQQAEPQPKPLRARLLVLPFLNLSGDSSQEYFSDAITDEIITALASLAPDRLAVIARTTAMRYKGAQKDVGRIGRELNVGYVVEGGIRRENDHAVVNVQVILTSDQSHLFARRYEFGLGEIFQQHSRIARDIATHLNAPGVTEEASDRFTLAQSRRPPTTNLAAYNEFIQGRYLAERLIPQEMTKAQQLLENAIAADPDFALAHMALADLYSWFGYTGYMRPKNAYAIGINYARRAVGIDENLAEAHAVLAAYHKQMDYDWAAAERSMARAVQLNPTSPLVKYSRAMVILMPQNRMQEAVAELRSALELDPLAGGTRCWLGIVLLLAGEYDRGIEEAQFMSSLEPNSCWPPFITGIAYRQKYYESSLRGVIRPEFAERAVAEHRRAAELAPGAEHLLAWLGFALGVCGHKAEARKILEQLRSSERYILPTNFGHLYLGLDDLDSAFEWFDRAVDERDQNMMPILSYAHFDRLRKDPRFQVLLRKMRLEAGSAVV